MLPTRIELEPAFVLHSRPYRETSLILDCITPSYGKVSAVARGASRRSSNLRALLQPFTALLISWQGKGSLKTLLTAEALPGRMPLQGKPLLSAFYLNELLLRLLRGEDHCQEIFAEYSATLAQLAQRAALEPTLRRFELRLLGHLGYGVPLPVMAELQARADLAGYYYYAADGHFLWLEQAPGKQDLQRCFQARDLLAITVEDFASQPGLRAAKRLMRMALAPLLGQRPLHSRELFADHS